MWLTYKSHTHKTLPCRQPRGGSADLECKNKSLPILWQHLPCPEIRELCSGYRYPLLPLWTGDRKVWSLGQPGAQIRSPDHPPPTFARTWTFMTRNLSHVQLCCCQLPWLWTTRRTQSLPHLTLAGQKYHCTSSERAEIDSICACNSGGEIWDQKKLQVCPS